MSKYDNMIFVPRSKFDEYLHLHEIDEEWLSLETSRKIGLVQENRRRGIKVKSLAMAYAYVLKCDYKDIFEGDGRSREAMHREGVNILRDI